MGAGGMLIRGERGEAVGLSPDDQKNRAGENDAQLGSFTPVASLYPCNTNRPAKRSASHSTNTRKAHTTATPAGDMSAFTNSRTITKISAFMAEEHPTPGY
jgi:hypothetical protein